MDAGGWLGSGGVAGLVVAAIATVIALAAALFAKRANHVSSSAYVSALVAEWGALNAEWVLSLLLARGVDDRYVPATTEQRQEARLLIAGASDHEVSREFTDNALILRSVAPSLRRVTRFLARCGELLVLGRLSPGEIYMVLGSDVVRHAAAVRWIIGADVEGTHGSSRWRGTRNGNLDWTLPEEPFHGEQDLVLALVDLLWAEAAKRGDDYPSSFLSVARHKRDHLTGVICRRRLRRLVLERGTRLFLALRLSSSLRDGEYVPVRTLRRNSQHLAPGDERLARWRRWPRPVDRWLGRLSFLGKARIPPANL